MAQDGGGRLLQQLRMPLSPQQLLMLVLLLPSGCCQGAGRVRPGHGQAQQGRGLLQLNLQGLRWCRSHSSAG